ncbi:MAG: hypothetical protein ACFNTU_05185 [Catonella sp.]
MAGRKRRSISKISKILYVLFAALCLAVISINKFMLDDRLVQAKVKNEAAKSYLKKEKSRAEELENLKVEIKTRKFIEDTAREKFGLTYENEIVFEPEK